MEELLSKAKAKLRLQEETTELRIVLEKDGTDIDDDECLAALTKDDVLVVIAPSQEWSEASPTVVNIYTDNHGSLTTEAGTLLPPVQVETPATPPIRQPIPGTPPTSRPPPCSSSSKVQSCFSTLQPAAVYSTITLSDFSNYVKAKLLAGDSHLVWTKLVQEAAFYYIANYPQIGSNSSCSDYKTVGQALCKTYPCIARDGTQPWALFNKNLSQKIRRIRWDNKRKSFQPSNCGPAQLTSPKRFRLKSSTSDSEPETDEYDVYVQELKDEVAKKDPNNSHVTALLRATRRQRRRWIANVPSGNVATVLETFPCFKLKTFIKIEMVMMLKMTSLPQVMNRFESVFDMASSLIKKKKDCDDGLATLRFIESETSFRHGKRSEDEVCGTDCCGQLHLYIIFCCMAKTDRSFVLKNCLVFNRF